jgi:radial spoke head protein 9
LEDLQPTPKSFSELQRLSFIVNTVENLCALVPIGAYKITPTHQLLLNDGFKGLNSADSTKLEKYQHFRPPQTEEKKEFIGIDIV